MRKVPRRRCWRTEAHSPMRIRNGLNAARRLRLVVPTLLTTLGMLACQVGRTPLPPPPSATFPPLPTVAAPTVAVPTPTPLAVATRAPTATTPVVSGSIGGWVWHDVCAAGQETAGTPAAPPPGCVVIP